VALQSSGAAAAAVLPAHHSPVSRDGPCCCSPQQRTFETHLGSVALNSSVCRSVGTKLHSEARGRGTVRHVACRPGLAAGHCGPAGPRGACC
jgi:hypothetical protein